MINLLKTLVAVILAAVGLLFLLLENPDEFKSELAEAISLNTPYQVSIEGNLAWRYWPPIAIEAEDVVLTAPNGALLAHARLMEIDVDLLPLLSRQHVVDVNSLSISGGWIDYEIKPAGNTNWTIPIGGQTGQSKDSPPPPTIHQFNLNNMTINYRAEQSYKTLVNHLTTSKLSLDSPFDISTSLEIEGHSLKEKIKIEATGQLIYASTNRLRFDRLVSTIGLGDDTELSINAAGELHTQRQVIILNEAGISYEAILASFTGIFNFAAEPRFDGELNLETASLNNLVDSPLPITALHLTSGLNASSQEVNLTTMEGGFDDTKFKGNLSVAMTEPLHLAGDLRFDQLQLSSNKQSSQPNTPTTTSATTSDPELLPLTLKPHRLDFILRVDKLRYRDFAFSDAKVEINSNRNQLELMANTKVLDGKLVASVTSDWSSSQLVASADRLDISTLTESRALTGSLTGHGEYDFKGNRLSHLEENLNGKTVVTISNGSIDVRPMKVLAATVDSLRGKQSRISTWPDDMQFKNMTSQHLFQNGTNSGQVLNAQIENLQLTASGGFSLAQSTLDYRLTAVFEQGNKGQFTVSDQLAGIRWPMRCQGNFSEEPVDLCFGQQGAIQDLVASIAKQELKRRSNKKLDDLIEEKVPEQLQDLTKDLLKGLFK